MTTYNTSCLYNIDSSYNDFISIVSQAELTVETKSLLVAECNIICEANLQVDVDKTIGEFEIDIISTASLTAKAKVERIIHTFDDYIKALKSTTREPILKIEFLDNNENVVSVLTPDIISGDLGLSSSNGARRNCNLVLDNTHGNYIPIPGEQLWINSKIRLWTGLKLGKEEYFISRGMFVIGEPEINSVFAEKTASISFYDKWTLLDGTLGGTLESDYIIDVGTSINAAIKAIFQQAGEIKTPIIAPTTETTPYTIVKEAGSTYAELLIEIANMLSWEVFYDRNGYPRFQPPKDVEKAGSSWDYTTDEVLYLGSQHRYEYSKVKNYVVVYGDNINGQLFKAIAQDTNEASPTRVNLIGKKVTTISDDLIYTNDLAQQRADYELQNLISLVETVQMNSIPVDIIEGGDIITVDDSSNGLNKDRFLVQGVNFPLTNEGQMSLNVWKARKLS